MNTNAYKSIDAEALTEENANMNTQKPKSKVWLFSLLIVVVVVVSLLGVANNSGNTNAFYANNRAAPVKYTNKIPVAADIIQVSPNEMYVTATNEYGQYKGAYSWMKDVPGTQLVEPYKPTTLTLSGSYIDSGNDYSYVWVLDGNTLDWNGPVFDLTMPGNVGKYTLEVHAFDSDGGYKGTYSTRIVCKYVKREIRSLTVADREAFLDAMATIWQYSQEEGQAKFGSKFTSIDTYVAIHSEASNDIMCDQYHEGSGFLTHHLAMGVSFEAALRSVNPAVTMPYWDFSIDGEAIYQAKKPPSHLLEISDIFSGTWFGSVDENNHIQDGRWAHALMPVATTPKMTQNSYGFIRSYWNNNPDPEISRHLFDACGAEPEHKAIPHCSTHFDILNSANLGVLQLLTPGDGHGPMHVQTGGVWGGCNDAYKAFLDKWGDVLNTDLTDEEIAAGGNDVAKFKNKWGPSAPRRMMVDKAIIGEYFHIYRSLWRSHMCAVDSSPALLECPESCDLNNTPFEECTCGVNKLSAGETDWKNLFPCVLNSAENQNYFSSTMPEELLKDLTTFLSTSSVLEGEMIESASTADPMFWMIHPVIERLVAAKRMPGVTKMGSKQFVKWDQVTEDDWLSYSYYNLAEGSNGFHSAKYTCTGHASTDPALPGDTPLPMTDAYDAIADANGDGVVSNWEFFQALDPTNIDGNDYVFDNFEWNHCS